MQSRVTDSFRALYRSLPKDIRKDAQEAYQLFKVNPFDPSLQFKEMSLTKNRSIWSARTGKGYRVVGAKPNDDTVVWVWIGSHPAYEKLIEAKRKARGANPQ